MSYWQDRLAATQDAISKKSHSQVMKRLKKYYAMTMKQIIADFEATYDKLLATVEEGREPTPADLYNLDKYWQLQAQTRARLQKLGDRSAVALSRAFEANFFEVYYALNIEGMEAFTTLDEAMARQVINQIWVADGKNFSQRIWDNTDRLLKTLEEGLLYTVTTGKKTTELKDILQERFGVSYRRADTLVRTELTHIQTVAAQKRYQDYGIQYVEVLVDVDARTCDKCKELVGKKFPVNATPPLPVHPNERCCVIPVID